MNTMTNYDSIDEALNTTSAIDAKPVSTPKKVKKTETDDVKKDYDYTRANLYSLIEKGQESLNTSRLPLNPKSSSGSTKRSSAAVNTSIDAFSICVAATL